MSLYRDPNHSAATGEGLILAMMRTPSSSLVSPEENQLSEALAWALRCSPSLAREFCALFVAGDSEAEAAVHAAGAIGVQTRVSARGPSGDVLFPDLSLCGSDGSFQLLVEVKVGADFHSYVLPDGTTASQPTMYAQALAGDSAGGARVRRVGTLSKDPASAPADAHPLRRRDVGWEEVRTLLLRHVTSGGPEDLVADLIRAIDARILPTPPDSQRVARLMDWANATLPEAARVLASRTGGKSGPLRSGKTEVYRGAYIDYRDPSGRALKLWLYASPAGSGYSVPGEPDAVYIQPDQAQVAKKDDRLRGMLALAFRWEREFAGWSNWRAWLPIADLEALGDADTQARAIAQEFTELLVTAELVPTPAE